MTMIDPGRDKLGIAVAVSLILLTVQVSCAIPAMPSPKLLAILTLTGAGNEVVFSPDGRTLAVNGGGPGEAVVLWEVASRRVRGVLRDRQRPHDTVAHQNITFAPDGAYLFTSARQTVLRWNLATGHSKTLRVRTDTYSALAFSHDRRTLALGDARGAVTLYDVTEHRHLGTLRVTDPVASLAFSRDGKELATGGAGRPPTYTCSKVRLWEISTARLRATLGEHAAAAEVTCLVFHQSGRRWLLPASRGRFGFGMQRPGR